MYEMSLEVVGLPVTGGQVCMQERLQSFFELSAYLDDWVIPDDVLGL